MVKKSPADKKQNIRKSPQYEGCAKMENQSSFFDRRCLRETAAGLFRQMDIAENIVPQKSGAFASM